MQKYYAPQRFISGDWSNEPLIKYRASEVKIREKITTYKDNSEEKSSYIIEFVSPEPKTSNFVFDKTARVDKLYENFDEAKEKCQMLNLALLQKHKEAAKDLEL